MFKYAFKHNIMENGFHIYITLKKGIKNNFKLYKLKIQLEFKTPATDARRRGTCRTVNGCKPQRLLGREYKT